MSRKEVLMPVGILGGAFDPVHIGHLHTAIELIEKFFLQDVYFVPCQTPVHKPPTIAEASDRLAMLKLAIDGEPKFHVDDREIRRKTPSYMVETLRSFREQFGEERPLALILGSDALMGFTSWRNWEEIFELAHLIVVPRGIHKIRLPAELEACLSFRKNKTPKTIVRSAAGEVFFQRTTKLDISSTAIRSSMKKNQSVRYLVPDKVWEYMQEQELYF